MHVGEDAFEAPVQLGGERRDQAALLESGETEPPAQPGERVVGCLIEPPLGVGKSLVQLIARQEAGAEIVPPAQVDLVEKPPGIGVGNNEPRERVRHGVGGAELRPFGQRTPEPQAEQTQLGREPVRVERPPQRRRRERQSRPVWPRHHENPPRRESPRPSAHKKL